MDISGPYEISQFMTLRLVNQSHAYCPTRPLCFEACVESTSRLHPTYIIPTDYPNQCLATTFPPSPMESSLATTPLWPSCKRGTCPSTLAPPSFTDNGHFVPYGMWLY